MLELILQLGALSNCNVKVIKLLYSLPKAGNYWLATYHTYHKKKLKMIKSTYNVNFFYYSSLFGIIGMQTNNILILADNNFASIKKDAIRLAKIMTKDRKHFTFENTLKFNNIQIKFDSNRIVLIKKSYVREILLVTDHVTNSISSRKITRKKLLPIKQYLVKRARGAYIAFIY